MSTDAKEKEAPLPLKKKQVSHPLLLTCLASMLLTVLTILFTYIILGFAPFGDQALIYKDGQQQMIDLLCWFKDVLTGKSSISYSFSKHLGGSNFAVFSYYLASPLNLLIVFFPKSQASTFMNILFLLKSSLAALFAAYYLGRRFRPDTRTKYGITVLLSVSYAFSQYLIAQSNNIMWLDGAYMLPLILAGVEKLISEKRSTLFIVSTSLTLIFNWYTGVIDLLFAGLWFLFESARLAITGDPEAVKLSSKKARSSHPALSAFGFSVLRFSVGCISAILCAAAVLLPTLSMLSGRSYGKSGIGMLTDFSMIGFVPNIISNYSFGFVSVKGGVSLFAGFFIILGVVLLFTSTAKALKEKLLYGGFLLLIVLSFYFQPLVAIFSMLREVESFWYRYSYVGSFALIYLAAIFYLGSDRKKIKLWIPPFTAAVFCIIVLLMTRPESHTTAEIIFSSHLASILLRSPNTYLDNLVSKILFPVLISLLLCLVFFVRKKRQDLFRVCAVLLSLSVVCELAMSQMVLSKIYATADAPYIERYSRDETALVDSIEDTTFYRIVQTSYHSSHHGLAASYNEPLAYNFRSVSSFVSAPDENSVAFLDRAGYPGYYDTISVTVSENLALDSLLSVKYVLLSSGDANTEGLEKLSGIDGFKDLYLNPYALSPVFVIPSSGSFDSENTNPARYLNDMYRHLSGIEKNIFRPVAPDITSDGAFVAQEEPGSILYAILKTNFETGATLQINDEDYTRYSQEMAPTMVRMHPVNGSAKIYLPLDPLNDQMIVDAQFYALDLEVLSEAVSAIRSRTSASYSIGDGHAKIEVSDAKAGTSLFTSIPDSRGWTVKLNGKKVDYDLTGSTFITIPLEEGDNIIEMSYSVPHLSSGIVLSIAGVLLLSVITYFERKKKDA